MAKEIRLPPAEKLDISDNSGEIKPEMILKIFDKSDIEKNIPIDLNNLQKSSLDYLGDFSTARDNEGYGIIYRLGIKYNVLDNEGDTAMLFLHYYTPFVEKGIEMNKDAEGKQEESIKKFNSLFALHMENMFGVENVISVSTPMPKWMIGELEKMIKGDKK